MAIILKKIHTKLTEKKKKTILFIVIALFITIALVYNSCKHEVFRDGKITVGIVTKYQFNNNNWLGKYSYEVDGEKYTGGWTGDFFKCPNGIEGCVGKEFPVRYSTENPEISEIDLREYDKRKIKPPRLW